MTDNEIAEVGSTTRLSELPDMLDDDDWNNIEPALFELVRKCIGVNEATLSDRQILAEEFAMALGWAWSNSINRTECYRHADHVLKRIADREARGN